MASTVQYLENLELENKTMTPEQLASHISVKSQNAEKKLQDVIDGYDKAIAMLDEQAGDDRTGKLAQQALMARKIQEGFKASLAMAKQAHCDASLLENDLFNAPMTRGGER